jgi:hypothetical protein
LDRLPDEQQPLPTNFNGRAEADFAHPFFACAEMALTKRRDSQTQTPQSDPAHVGSETQRRARGKKQRMEKTL